MGEFAGMVPHIYYLEPEEFDRVVADLLNPSEPSPAILRGAELLRELYERRGLWFWKH